MHPVKFVIAILSVTYAAVAALFAIAGVALVAFASRLLWAGATGDGDPVARAGGIIESIGLLAVSLVALEIAQTIVEEEVIRRAQVSAPTRVRRYLSRFLVVIVVALSIKFLVAVVGALHDESTRLWDAAAIGIGTAALLAAWGLFLRMNTYAEELEPEAMAEAKGEDEKVQ